jgi:hypothetical protein
MRRKVPATLFETGSEVSETLAHCFMASDKRLPRGLGEDWTRTFQRPRRIRMQ